MGAQEIYCDDRVLVDCDSLLVHHLMAAESRAAGARPRDLRRGDGRQRHRPGIQAGEERGGYVEVPENWEAEGGQGGRARRVDYVFCLLPILPFYLVIIEINASSLVFSVDAVCWIDDLPVIAAVCLLSGRVWKSTMYVDMSTVGPEDALARDDAGGA